MKEEAQSELELRIPRRPEFVRVARKAAGALAHQFAFTVLDVGDIELAVDEACTNAVEHVSEEACEEIVVRFAVDAEHLVVEVVDRGPGFDPSEVEREAPGEETIGGLGLAVIKSVMDELEVSCDAKRGTRVRMVKYRQRQEA